MDISLRTGKASSVSAQPGVVKQDLIPLDSRQHWTDALKGIQHAFAHTWESCYAMQLTTGHPTYLYSFEMGPVRIVCPIAERTMYGHTDIVTPYGFSGFVGNGDCEPFRRCWKRFMKAKGYVCGYIGLNPIFEKSSYYQPEEAYSYNNIYVLDLTLSHDELFHNLSNNRKRQLRVWDAIRKDFVLEKEILIDFLLANFAGFFERKHASAAYSFSHETVAYIANLENVFLVGMRNSGRIEAVSVFGWTPHSGDFLFNVSLPEGQRHSAALIWYAVSYLKDLEVPTLNLGGGIREGDGVADFKQRFGAQRLVLTSLKQIYAPDVYECLCRQAGANPDDRSGYFPPYRKA